MIFFFCFTLTIIVPSGSQDSPEIDRTLIFLKRCHISSVVNVNAKVSWDGLTQHMNADAYYCTVPLA